jgi:hypothetical protein
MTGKQLGDKPTFSTYIRHHVIPCISQNARAKFAVLKGDLSLASRDYSALSGLYDTRERFIDAHRKNLLLGRLLSPDKMEEKSFKYKVKSDELHTRAVEQIPSVGIKTHR